jgi:nitrate/TMAO reductase-like tetraheme cytochrome c subunit
MALRVLSGIGLFALIAMPAFGASDQAGITSGTLFRVIGLVAAGLAIVGLILVQFVYYDRFHRTTRHWILLVLLLVFPLISMLGTMETVMEETKSVDSCNSCHVMEPFVNDMQDDSSATLAAQHVKNSWIPKNQCYQCHTTYGVHGTLAAKRDGFRHWLLYVTQTYEEPIQYSGSYPNVNCTSCHAGSPDFQAVEAHASLRERLANDRVSCASCHGPPHPAPPDRPGMMTTHHIPTEPTASAHD